MASQARALLRIEEVADILGISRARAYAMAADGQLPSVRIGRSRRVPVRQLEAWIEQHVLDAKATLSELPTTESGVARRPEAVDVVGQELELP